MVEEESFSDFSEYSELSESDLGMYQNTFGWKCVVCHGSAVDECYVEGQWQGCSSVVLTDIGGRHWIRCSTPKCQNTFHYDCWLTVTARQKSVYEMELVPFRCWLPKGLG